MAFDASYNYSSARRRLSWGRWLLLVKFACKDISCRITKPISYDVCVWARVCLRACMFSVAFAIIAKCRFFWIGTNLGKFLSLVLFRSMGFSKKFCYFFMAFKLSCNYQILRRSLFQLFLFGSSDFNTCLFEVFSTSFSISVP